LIETDQGAFFYAQIFGSRKDSALRGNVRGARTRQFAGRFIETACHHTRRPSSMVLACSPSRDLTRHGCRV